VTLLRPDKAINTADPLLEWSLAGAREVLKEETFKRMIAVERKRTERSGEPLLLMLLELATARVRKRPEKALDNTLSVLSISIRETDVIGWYTDRTTVGVMFTGLSRNDKNSILSVIINKVSTTLRDQLTTDQFNQITISFHFLPDDWDQDNPERRSNPSLYPDLLNISFRCASGLPSVRTMDRDCPLNMRGMRRRSGSIWSGCD
jgi:hypothetical protein